MIKIDFFCKQYPYFICCFNEIALNLQEQHLKYES